MRVRAFAALLGLALGFALGACVVVPEQRPYYPHYHCDQWREHCWRE